MVDCLELVISVAQGQKNKDAIAYFLKFGTIESLSGIV